MRCNRVKERDIAFDSHISGFVYKVRVNDEVLIKKEIPGPDTVDEFLYEINALNRLKHSNHVIRFYGVIVDDNEDHVKGLLISHAEQGALIDIIYDQIHPLPWSTRERWARQIVAGLSEIHEAGFVQGDFTLSNIVIDDDDNAKIIDINRRGCPVGWEPPEATPLIESNQRISMYIGVKSDLYQLGMVLWSLAMKEDEPEAHGRPLRIGSHILDVPNWFRRVVDICLSEDPRGRMPALQLLSIFPDPEPESDVDGLYDRPSISVDDGVTRREYFVDADPAANGYPRIRTVQPASDWSYVGWGHSYVNSPNGVSDEPFFYPTRGRSPPSPLPSNPGEYDSSKYGYRAAAWASTTGSARTAPSESDSDTEEEAGEDKKGVTPRKSQLSVADAEQLNVTDAHEEQKPATKLPAEETHEALAVMPDIDDHAGKTQQPGEPQTPEGKTPEQRQQAVDTSIPNSLAGLNTGHKECEVGKTESFDHSAVVEHVEDQVKGPPETGHTEPEIQRDTSGPSSAGNPIPRDWDIDRAENDATAVDATNVDRPLDEVERAPETVTVLTSEPPPEKIGDTAQAATLPTDTEETPKETGMTTDTTLADTTLADPSNSTSDVHMSGDEHCDVPDDLKGVGSTYGTGPENWHQSMTNHDIAELIDAEMAADAKNDSSNDTTVMKQTNI
jgi:serine/threonine protein kinase